MRSSYPACRWSSSTCRRPSPSPRTRNGRTACHVIFGNNLAFGPAPWLDTLVAPVISASLGVATWPSL
ncbi:hypothetical protein SAM23877_7355 [Streptomyces ambofaciens ATCC 23877]|uniref:Uncharacterized protein n=1 Tax=Streptomyces ambofaciens (strain ATCC 23877 / 3486 / DSM 40053 / JCM 4204 / NBRC 12836 / NRRL B-2516) TaxID=278992 RepID=A0A0K2B5H4_STRA7|nr:hypothetical protein SAM23877_7355 [Streptomyces ambofaciens ATCC 23877]